MTSAMSTLSRKRETLSGRPHQNGLGEEKNDTHSHHIVVNSWATSLSLPLEFDFLLRMSDQFGQLFFDWLIPAQPGMTSPLTSDEEVPFRPIPPRRISEAQVRYEYHGRGKPPAFPPDEE